MIRDKDAHKKHTFLREGVTLLSGNVWAQMVAFLGYFVLARLYSPTDFGLYSMFFSYLEMFLIISTCKYELGIVIAKDKREAGAIEQLSLRINRFVSIILLVIILILRTLPSSVSFLSDNTNFTIALLLPFMVYFCGTSRIYSAICNRERIFKQISLSEIIGSSSGLAAKIALGLNYTLNTIWHSTGLAIGTVVGKMVSNINYKLSVKKINLPTDITKSERHFVRKKYSNFLYYTTSKDLINSISYNLPFIWLALYFDKAEVGLLGMAFTCTMRPCNMFNGVFEKLFYVRMAEHTQQGKPFFHEVSHFLFVLNSIAIPFASIIFFAAEPLLSFCFGPQWVGIGWYIRTLIPWMVISLSSTSLMFVANVLGKQRTEFLFYVVLLLLRIISVAMGITRGNFHLAITLFSLSGCLISLCLLVWYLKLLRKQEQTLSQKAEC